MKFSEFLLDAAAEIEAFRIQHGRAFAVIVSFLLGLVVGLIL